MSYVFIFFLCNWPWGQSITLEAGMRWPRWPRWPPSVRSDAVWVWPGNNNSHVRCQPTAYFIHQENGLWIHDDSESCVETILDDGKKGHATNSGTPGQTCHRNLCRKRGSGRILVALETSIFCLNPIPFERQADYCSYVMLCPCRMSVHSAYQSTAWRWRSCYCRLGMMVVVPPSQEIPPSTYEGQNQWCPGLDQCHLRFDAQP